MEINFGSVSWGVFTVRLAISVAAMAGTALAVSFGVSDYVAKANVSTINGRMDTLDNNIGRNHDAVLASREEINANFAILSQKLDRLLEKQQGLETVVAVTADKIVISPT